MPPMVQKRPDAQLGGGVPALALLLPPPPPPSRQYAAWCASAFFSPTDYAARSEATRLPASRAGASASALAGISPPGGEMRSGSASRLPGALISLWYS